MSENPEAWIGGNVLGNDPDGLRWYWPAMKSDKGHSSCNGKNIFHHKIENPKVGIVGNVLGSDHEMGCVGISRRRKGRTWDIAVYPYHKVENPKVGIGGNTLESDPDTGCVGIGQRTKG